VTRGTALPTIPIVLASLLALPVGAASAEDRPRPAWVTAKARFSSDPPARAFVATGRSGESGPADYKSEQAEDAARQDMGQLIADWQERVLACAKKASDSKTTAKSRSGTGALLNFEIQSETTVSFYRDRVADRAYDGKFILVLLRHELAPMIAGILVDATRSAGLRASVQACGEKAFDELAAKR
jgi:hypothetical protein